ncbi:MAG: Intracellular protease, partial [uncultured Solirubrobacteraceae bacterium]
GREHPGGQAHRVPRGPGGRRAGRAHRPVEGGGGGRWSAGAPLARGGRDPGLQPSRQGRHVRGRQGRLRRGRRRLPRPRPPRRRRQPGHPAHGRGRRRVRPRVLPAGQAGGRHLSRRVDAGRGRRARGPHDHVVAVAAHGHRQRGRALGGRGGRRRRGSRLLAQPGRPAGVLRQARRGARRGQARGAAPQRRDGRL